MPLKILWIISSLLIIGCGVPRPKGDICIVDARREVLRCYDMEKDYNDDGTLKPGAVQHTKPAINIDSVNKFTVFDPDAWAEVKIYIGKVKERYKECK